MVGLDVAHRTPNATGTLRPARPGRRRWLLGTILSSQLLIISPARAQVVTHVVADIAAGRSVGTLVKPGPAGVTIDGGTLAGGNLFESFSQFSLAAGDTAAWTYSFGDAARIQNVINRVTGGVPSRIDGTIDSTGIPNADFYFINPAGIVFGAGARINVPAAAYFSTASALRFADGASYSAVTASGSTLTVAPPAAFGFLGGEGDIALGGVGSSFFPGAGKLSLTASNIQISNAQFQSGALDLVAVGDQATSVNLTNPTGGDALDGNLNISGSQLSTAPGFPAAGATNLDAGEIGLSNASIQALASNTAPGGPLTIAAGSFKADRGSTIFTFSTTSEAAGAFAATVSGGVTVENGSWLGSSSTGGGSAGRVSVSADTILIDGGSKPRNSTFISSYSLGGGDAGFVSISASGSLTLQNNGDIASTTAGAGNVGGVGIEAGDMVLRRGAFVGADADGTGVSGNVSVSAANLMIDGAGAALGFTGLFSNTVNANDAGRVLVTVPGALTVQNGGAITAQTLAGGAAGLVAIRSGSLAVVNDGFVNSSTFGSGDAGDVTVTARIITVDGGEAGVADISSESATDLAGAVGTGNAGNVTVRASGPITLRDGGFIGSQAVDGAGDAGAVTVSAGSLFMDGANTFISSNVQAGERGGATTVNIDGDLTIQNGALISSDTYGAGDGGVVSVSVGGALLVRSGAAVLADTFGGGSAGNVSVSAGAVLVDGGGAASSTIASNSTTDSTGVYVGSGDAGAVTLTVRGDVTVQNGGSISSEADDGTGNAGSVTVTGANILLDAGTAGDLNSFISSATFGSGRGGRVEVSTPGNLTVRDGAFIGADTFGSGDGGIVTVTAANLLIDGGNAEDASISSQSTFNDQGNVGTGDSGAVTVKVVGKVVIENGGDITSEADDETGSAGSVTVSGANILIDAGTAGDQTSFISSDSFGAGHGGRVSVSTSGNLTVQNGAYIAADTFGSGDGGSVAVTAASLVVDGGAAQDAFISADSADDGLGDVGTGNAGSVAINVSGSLVVRNSAYVSSEADDRLGSAGNVTITAGSLTLDGGADGAGSTIISSATLSSDNGGNVSVSVGGELRVLNGAYISASTSGMGAAGDVEVSAGSLFMDGEQANTVGYNYIASNTFASGNGGKVDVAVVGQLTLQNGSAIGANTFGTGTAGDVTVSAKNLSVDGGSAGFAYISSASTTTVDGLVGSGSAGTVHVTVADSLTLENGGYITTSATDAQGSAGDVSVVSGTLTLDGGTGGPGNTYIASSTRTPGDAGDVAVDVSGGITILNGAIITAATSGAGAAGDVHVSGASLTMDGGTANTSGFNYIGSDTFSSGTGGNVSVAISGHVSISNGASITANTYGTGSAGDVNVTAGTLALDGAAAGYAFVASSSTTSSSSGLVGLGNAGKVGVNVAGNLLIEDGGTISTSANDSEGAAGNLAVTSHDLSLQSGGFIETNSANVNPAGNIVVNAPQIVVGGLGSAISSANTGANGGRAGSITINTDPITLSDGGAITTDSRSGAAGSITLNFAQGGLLTLEGTSAVSEITTTSGTATAGQITVRGPSAIIMNGGEIQARGPFRGAFVTIDAGSAIESSDRPNTIDVAGTLVFDSTFEQVSNAVTVSDLTFVDASKVLKGECTALAASGETSALVTKPTGPYAMNASEDVTEHAAIEPHDRVCGMAPTPR